MARGLTRTRPKAVPGAISRKPNAGPDVARRERKGPGISQQIARAAAMMKDNSSVHYDEGSPAPVVAL